MVIVDGSNITASLSSDVRVSCEPVAPDAPRCRRQVQKLSSDNQRLQEESRQAARQLRKFTQWFLDNVEKP